MSVRRLVERPRAQRDVLEMIDYVAEQSGEVAADLYNAYEETLEILRAHPEIGKRCPPLHPTFANLRWLPIRGFAAYLVFTAYDGMTLEIVRVLHSSRNISAVFEDESA